MSLTLSLLLASAASAQYVPSAAERLCGPGVYCAEKMVCVSRIEGEKPKGMHPDYFTSVVTFKAMKSTKRLKDGTRTLVDALQTNEEFTGPNGISLEEAKAMKVSAYGYYGPPAKVVNGRGVLMTGGGYSEGFRFTIVSSQTRADGVCVDQLVGEEFTEGSVVGDYNRRFKCEAEVVAAPSRVDDFTKY